MSADWIFLGFLVAIIIALILLDLTYEIRKSRLRRKMYLKVARKRRLTHK